MAGKKTLADKELWWTDARKMFLGQALTLLLTPASVALTFYLTQHYKAPDPRVEYISATPRVFAYAPPASFAEQIRNESSLAATFRELLPRLSLSLKDPGMCT